MRPYASDMLLGIRTWFQSWAFIFRHRLLHFFLFPIAMQILLSMGIVSIIEDGIESLMSLIYSLLGIQQAEWMQWNTSFVQILKNITDVAIRGILWITAFYTFLKISKYLILALMSPIMARLSERTSEILTGEKIPFNLAQFFKDVIRGIALAFRNLFAELLSVWGLMTANFLIGMIAPPVAVVTSALTSILIVFIGAYYYGFSTMDYVNERNRLTVGQSVRDIRLLKGVAIGNGLMFTLFFSIPFIGISIGTITCTVAAMLAKHEIQEKKGGINEDKNHLND